MHIIWLLTALSASSLPTAILCGYLFNAEWVEALSHLIDEETEAQRGQTLSQGHRASS